MEASKLSGVFSIIRQYVVMLVAAPLGGIFADKVFKSTLNWFRFGGAVLAVFCAVITVICSVLYGKYVKPKRA